MHKKIKKKDGTVYRSINLEGYNYYVSQDGVVINSKGWELAERYDRNGYRVAKLSNKGIKFYPTVHSLILRAWVDEVPKRYARFLDGDIYNYNLSNLYWSDNDNWQDDIIDYGKEQLWMAK